MNKDFRVSTSLVAHPKTVKLMRRLGDKSFFCLIKLWSWVAQDRPSGDISGLDAEDIEIISGWDGDYGRFLETLIELGFVEADGDRLRVHDWQEHNPWAASAEDRSESGRLHRMKRTHPEIFSLLHEHGFSSGISREQFLEITSSSNPLRVVQGWLKVPLSHPVRVGQAQSPSPAPEEKEKELHNADTPAGERESAAAPAGADCAQVRQPRKGKRTTGETDGPCYLAKGGRKLTGNRLVAFDRFWAAFAYPRGKAEAAAAWLDIPQLTDSLVDQICAAAAREAERRPQLEAAGRTPKMAQGWLSSRRWEDEPDTPRQPATRVLTDADIAWLTAPKGGPAGQAAFPRDGPPGVQAQGGG